MMSQRPQPKFRASRKLDNGDIITLAVWPGKANPEDEVISVQLRRMQGEWRTVGRLAVYHTSSGAYSQLPDTTDTAPKSDSKPPPDQE